MISRRTCVTKTWRMSVGSPRCMADPYLRFISDIHTSCHPDKLHTASRVVIHRTMPTQAFSDDILFTLTTKTTLSMKAVGVPEFGLNAQQIFGFG